MTTSKTDEAFAQLVHRIDPQSRLLRTWQMTGGVSAQVTGIELVRPHGQTQKMLVRRHGEMDRQHNPQIAADEFKLLQGLHAAGLATPQPYFVDQAIDRSSEIFGTPCIVIQFVEGKTEFAPADLDGFSLQLATHLAQIHALDSSQFDFSFLPKLGKGFGERPAKLDLSLDEGRIRDRLESLVALPSANKIGLLHGDYWPGNILWQDGKLAAVIDWEDAQLGDPLADVANCRLELLWALDSEAMERFTQDYRALTTLDFSHLPYWDLCAALRPANKLGSWGLAEDIEKRMRERHHWFVEQAFEQLRLRTAD